MAGLFFAKLKIQRRFLRQTKSAKGFGAKEIRQSRPQSLKKMQPAQRIYPKIPKIIMWALIWIEMENAEEIARLLKEKREMC